MRQKPLVRTGGFGASAGIGVPGNVAGVCVPSGLMRAVHHFSATLSSMPTGLGGPSMFTFPVLAGSGGG